MEKEPEKIGNTEVIGVERVGGFVIKKLASEMPDGPLAPDSKEAQDVVNAIADRLSKPGTYKTTIKNRPAGHDETDSTNKEEI